MIDSMSVIVTMRVLSVKNAKNFCERHFGISTLNSLSMIDYILWDHVLYDVRTEEGSRIV